MVNDTVLEIARQEAETAIQEAERLLGEFPFQYRAVRVGDLNFDENYQRSENRAKVAEIARDWDELGMGVIFVNEREDGSLWGMDGRQRSGGTLKRWGADKLVEARVYLRLTPAQEAAVFYYLNGKRGPVKANVRFNAAFQSGDGDVCQIAEVLEKLGIAYDFGPTGGTKKVVCWAKMYDLLRHQSAEHLELVLGFVLECWGADRASLQAVFLQGVSLFIRNHEKDTHWEWSRVINRMQQVSSEEIERRRHEKQSGASHPGAGHAIYFTLHDLFNKGRRNVLGAGENAFSVIVPFDRMKWGR